MNDLLNFQSDFENGTSCSIEVDLAAVRRDNKICPKTTWSGRRTVKMFPKYLAWIHTVNLDIAKVARREHVFVLQAWLRPPHWQFWVYRPNGEKELVAEADGTYRQFLAEMGQ